MGLRTWTRVEVPGRDGAGGDDSWWEDEPAWNDPGWRTRRGGIYVSRGAWWWASGLSAFRRLVEEGERMTDAEIRVHVQVLLEAVDVHETHCPERWAVVLAEAQERAIKTIRAGLAVTDADLKAHRQRQLYSRLSRA